MWVDRTDLQEAVMEANEVARSQAGMTRPPFSCMFRQTTGARAMDATGSGLSAGRGHEADDGDAIPAGRRAKSPQERKALSYSRDRRNGYGENDKASRKNIPRTKARSHCLLRRADKAALRDVDAALKAVPLRLRKPDWKKQPDITLSLHVRRQRLLERVSTASSTAVSAT